MHVTGIKCHHFLEFLLSDLCEGFQFLLGPFQSCLNKAERLGKARSLVGVSAEPRSGGMTVGRPRTLIRINRLICPTT